jgi:hypothetical protein
MRQKIMEMMKNADSNEDLKKIVAQLSKSVGNSNWNERMPQFSDLSKTQWWDGWWSGGDEGDDMQVKELMDLAQPGAWYKPIRMGSSSASFEAETDDEKYKWTIWKEDGTLDLNMVLFFSLIGLSAALWSSLLVQLFVYCTRDDSEEEYYVLAPSHEIMVVDEKGCIATDVQKGCIATDVQKGVQKS